ncbi:MAG TPA: SCP2 sterol-binding domain-containing protein [Actinomycetota bacterium]
MATPKQVEKAIRSLGKKLQDANPDPGMVPDRSILCVITDLDTAFWAQLKDGKLNGLRETSTTEAADARITARSDDLIALIEGRMGVGSAFFTGKVRIDAPVSDLLLLRKIF